MAELIGLSFNAYVPDSMPGSANAPATNGNIAPTAPASIGVVVSIDSRSPSTATGLDLADIYVALTYFHSNPKEMRQVEREREARLETAEEYTTLTTPLGA